MLRFRWIGPTRFLIFCHDMLAMGLSLLLATFVRLGLADMPPGREIAVDMLLIMALAAPVLGLLGLNRGLWRFASFRDMYIIIASAALTVIAFTLLQFMLNRGQSLPRSVPLLTFVFGIGLLAGPRLIYRSWKDGRLALASFIRRRQGDAAPALIIGSANEVDQALRSLPPELSRSLSIAGIVDYSPHRRGHALRGLPFLGSLDEIRAIIAGMRHSGTPPQMLLVATTPGNNSAMQAVLDATAGLKVPLQRISHGHISGAPSAVRSVTIEDLLSRDTVALDPVPVESLIRDQVVLITGAGGSIGSEIVRQVAAQAPAKVILVDHSEFALFEIEQELTRTFPAVAHEAVIASVRDEARIEALFAAHTPALVFHAAALKHVPLVEHNVCEGVLTNVVGSRIIADRAVRHGARAVVMISTDKAIRPSSVMGATKRIAEAYCQALDLSGVTTRFITVRFGNVLGSTGSVVPIFRRQIEAGGPVTITDPEMMRYFMTIGEATALVLQAAAMGVESDGQRGRIMVLDMGEPVKIIDLARKMILLAGLKPDVDIPIVVTGLRPGEKLFEELFDKNEPTVPSPTAGVFVAEARVIALGELAAALAPLEAAARAGDAQACRVIIRKIVAL